MKFKILLLSLILLVTPIVSSAQTLLTTPFGGKILSTLYCTCSKNFYVLFSDVTKMMAPTPMIYQPGVSRLNQNFNVFTSGVNLLGTYAPIGKCRMYTGDGCHTLPTRGTITPYPGPGVGTSSF